MYQQISVGKPPNDGMGTGRNAAYMRMACHAIPGVLMFFWIFAIFIDNTVKAKDIEDDPFLFESMYRLTGDSLWYEIVAGESPKVAHSGTTIV